MIPSSPSLCLVYLTTCKHKSLLWTQKKQLLECIQKLPPLFKMKKDSEFKPTRSNEKIQQNYSPRYEVKQGRKPTTSSQETKPKEREQRRDTHKVNTITAVQSRIDNTHTTAN